MARTQPIVFLCAAGDERGCAAARSFDAVAVRMGLPWRAVVSETADGDARLVARVAEWQDVEREVNALVAKLLGGGEFVETAQAAPPPKPAPKLTAKVGRETKGRRGKGVTVVSGLSLADDELRQLAATLKQRCGTGGTVEDDRIIIQGDLRERVAGELERLGYRVTRAGG